MTLLQNALPSTSDEVLRRDTVKALGYPPLWEDTPMTLQVALVGTDGIVLASDKKTVLRGNDLVDRSFLRSKVLIDSAEEIAIAHSGNEFSETVAQRILSSTAPVKQKLSTPALESVASEVWGQDTWQSLDRRGELIIVSKDDLSHVRHVLLGPLVIGNKIEGARAKLTRIDDKACAGHASNPAIFFSEHYYEKKPIAELVFLAAHVICTGNRRNPGGIEGLEVIKCGSQGFQQLSDSSISELVKRSNELDASIKKDIFTPHRLM